MYNGLIVMNHESEGRSLRFHYNIFIIFNVRFCTLQCRILC